MNFEEIDDNSLQRDLALIICLTVGYDYISLGGFYGLQKFKAILC